MAEGGAADDDEQGATFTQFIELDRGVHLVLNIRQFVAIVLAIAVVLQRVCNPVITWLKQQWRELLRVLFNIQIARIKDKVSS